MSFYNPSRPGHPGNVRAFNQNTASLERALEQLEAEQGGPDREARAALDAAKEHIDFAHDVAVDMAMVPKGNSGWEDRASWAEAKAQAALDDVRARLNQAQRSFEALDGRGRALAADAVRDAGFGGDDGYGFGGGGSSGRGGGGGSGGYGRGPTARQQQQRHVDLPFGAMFDVRPAPRGGGGGDGRARGGGGGRAAAAYDDDRPGVSFGHVHDESDY